METSYRNQIIEALLQKEIRSSEYDIAALELDNTSVEKEKKDLLENLEKHQEALASFQKVNILR